MIMHVLQEISGTYIIIYMYTYHVKYCRKQAKAKAEKNTGAALDEIHMVLNQNRQGNEHVSLMSGELKKKKCHQGGMYMYVRVLYARDCSCIIIIIIIIYMTAENTLMGLKPTITSF